jgi:isocitrate/isopropylmalate dehydrogenase
MSTSSVTTTKSRHYNVASIPADGIGPEVVSAAIEVIQKLAQVSKSFTIEFEHIPWGTAYYKEHGRYVDENVLDVLRRYDAILFGSVGAPGTTISSIWLLIIDC